MLVVEPLTILTRLGIVITRETVIGTTAVV
jgi:hypothetical protein